jgi:hypothetical protein
LHPHRNEVVTVSCTVPLILGLRSRFQRTNRTLPSNLRLLLTGFSDQVAYEYGFLNTDLPFEKAREAFRIGEWMREVPLDEKFSERLREFLKRQGADNVPP